MNLLTADLIKTKDHARRHRVWLTIFSVTLAAATLCFAVRGFSYYRLPLADRPFHPDHQVFHPGGAVGIWLGLAATAMFVLIYLYPLRKKWKFMRFLGSTKNVLDYHIAMGLCAPFVVAMHSALKFRGIAGVSFFVMLAVVLSGIVGRYLYAQIPRSRKDTEFSLVELQHLRTEAALQLETMEIESGPEWEHLMTPVSRERVVRMSLFSALFYMFWLDVRRPFQIAALRRRNLSLGGKIITLGGLVASTHADLEATIRMAKRQSWLSAKIFFLDRASQIFHLWHVVHRPFSYAFLVLAILHIGMVMWMGFL